MDDIERALFRGESLKQISEDRGIKIADVRKVRDALVARLMEDPKNVKNLALGKIINHFEVNRLKVRSHRPRLEKFPQNEMFSTDDLGEKPQ